MPDHDRHVVPNPEGGWDVKAPGAQRGSSHHSTQAAAIDAARQIVHNQGGGELVIHNTHGQIRDQGHDCSGARPLPAKGVAHSTPPRRLRRRGGAPFQLPCRQENASGQRFVSPSSGLR